MKLYEQHCRFNGRIQWKHVHAHRGVPGNERADKISCSYAKNTKPQLFKGGYSSYGIDLLSLTPQINEKLVAHLKTEIQSLKKACDMWSKRALKAEADLKTLTQHPSLEHSPNSKGSFTLITKELLLKNKTEKGGWTKDQIESLGLKWPLQSGWQSEVIGKTISEENLRRFEDKLSVKQSRK